MEPAQNAATVNKAVRGLRNNKAKIFVPMVEGSQKIGSGSIMPAYWCILTESQLFDVRSDSSFDNKFILASDYGNTTAAIQGEFGALNVGLRLLPVPDADAEVSAGGGATGGSGVAETSSNADVHSAFCVGREAAGGVNLAVGNAGVINKALGSSGTHDALDQRSTVGWKKYDARTILNNAFLQEIQSAVTA